MKSMTGFAMALGLLSTVAVPTPKAEAQMIAQTAPLAVNAVFIGCANPGSSQDVAKSPTLKNTLPGISRAVVAELAGDLGVGFVERDFQVFHVINADEAFTASTPYCLMPVTRVNARTIADGRPGRVYRRLQAAWNEKVGVDIERQICDGARRRQTAQNAESSQ